MATTMNQSQPARKERKRKKKRDIWSVLGWGFMVLLIIFTVVPMFWMIITSLKGQFAALQYPPQWYPHDPTLEH